MGSADADMWDHAFVSYDLAVYARRTATSRELAELVAQSGAMGVGDESSRSFTVVRGTRRTYSFTVDGPDAVDLEDVPADVVIEVLDVQWLYSVSVEGSASVDIPHAVRFARRLAALLDGAVVDQQADSVWSRSRSRSVARPDRQSRVSTIELSWFCLREAVAEDAATLFIDLAQKVLPEALPRRFGEYEPLQGKFAESGRDGFGRAWTDATSLFFTAGSVPCVGGSMSPGPNERFPDRFWTMNLEFLAEPMLDPAWQAALRGLFISLADELPAFFASAEVTSGHIWSGRSLWADGETEERISPVRAREGWTGLPPRPTWWAWLGHPYAEYYAALPMERTSATKEGVLYEASTAPTSVPDLIPLASWLPEGLFSQLAPNPTRRLPAPLIHATSIPGELRG